METVKPEVETSNFVDIFTNVLPFFLLAVMILIIIAIIYIVKIFKRYLTNSKMVEQKLKLIETDIQETKQRLDRIEKNLK
ncbi:hypothetical protein [Bacillus sp. E214]|uniref:hypothetical protein n=1 Tax=Bacillus sp. E214 TaxID=2587156 RepID=UPI0011DFE95C|nr:hypothetical protein [Bacillus sp. E214]